MLRFVDNFFAYGNVGTSLTQANSTFNTQWIVHGSIPSVISAGFTDDAKAVTLSRNNSGTSRLERRIETTENVVVIGFAFRATARNATIFSIDGVVDLEWPAGFKINDEVSPTTILINRLYYVEIKLNKTTKEVVLKVNGYDYLTTTITADIPDTLQCFWGYTANGPAAEMSFSNIYWLDSSAGKYTDFIGPQTMSNRVPTAAVDNTWTAEPTGKTNVAIMQNMPPNVNEFTESDVVGSRDFYTSDQPIDNQSPVTAVAVTALIAKTDIDDQFIALSIGDGTTVKEGGQLEVPIQPTFLQTVFETDVSDGDWEPTAVVDTEFGPIIKPRI